VEPQFSGRVAVGEQKRADREIDQIREDRTEQEKSDIDLRVTEDLTEEPHRSPEMPEQHQDT